jgi:uncharacterized protein YjcR
MYFHQTQIQKYSEVQNMLWQEQALEQELHKQEQKQGRHMLEQEQELHMQEQGLHMLEQEQELHMQEQELYMLGPHMLEQQQGPHMLEQGHCKQELKMQQSPGTEYLDKLEDWLEQVLLNKLVVMLTLEYKQEVDIQVGMGRLEYKLEQMLLVLHMMKLL